MYLSPTVEEKELDLQRKIAAEIFFIKPVGCCLYCIKDGTCSRASERCDYKDCNMISAASLFLSFSSCLSKSRPSILCILLMTPFAICQLS